jgi:uncharacterized protein (DUF427 family)
VENAMNDSSTQGNEIKIPGPDHPIRISPAEGKVRVTVAGRIVAESTRALQLEEKGYPPVYVSIIRIQTPGAAYAKDYTRTE